MPLPVHLEESQGAGVRFIFNWHSPKQPGPPLPCPCPQGLQIPDRCRWSWRRSHPHPVIPLSNGVLSAGWLPGFWLRSAAGWRLALMIAHYQHRLMNVSAAWLAWQPQYFGEIVLSWGMEITARKSREAQPKKNAGS